MQPCAYVGIPRLPKWEGALRNRGASVIRTSVINIRSLRYANGENPMMLSQGAGRYGSAREQDLQTTHVGKGE